MSRYGFLTIGAAILALVIAPAARAQEIGDALQLLSYGVSSSTAPNVLDGQIASVTDPTDWQSAYVRVIRVGIDGDPGADPRPATLLVANDPDTLYIGVAVELPNASQNNRLTLYFDQGQPGTLDGSAGAVGEYFVTALADGSAPQDGHWNGSSWALNTSPAVTGIGLRKGTSGADRLYNFEFKVPLRRLGAAGNSYLDVAAGDEIGVFPAITLNTADEYYWLDTNDNPTDPSAVALTGESGWGQIQTIGSGIADRNVVSLGALDIVPTIDGVISGDENWKYGFRKDIVLSDFAGGKYDATLRLKDRAGPESLIIGLSINGLVPAAGDFFTVYLDQGSNGGPLNYVLTDGGDPIADNGARVTGTGAFQDLHFDSNSWVVDAASNGTGAASVSGTGDWEVEMSLPFDSGDPQDLSIALEDGLGLLLEFRDAATGRSYWWSATINDNDRIIDPVDPVNNALGWGFLQTGGPFIQPIYPEDGDVLSGEYPLAVYAVDPGDPTPETGIERIRYEVRQEDPVAGTFVTLLSGDLAKVEDPGIAIWTATLDTRAVNVAPSQPLRLVFEVFDGEVDPVSVPIEIFVDNSRSLTSLDDPTVTVDAPAGGSIVSGDAVDVSFSATTKELLALDLLELLVDGVVVETITPTDFDTTGTYVWNTTTARDGEHILQARAVNSLGFENVSPAVLVVVDNGPPTIQDLIVQYPSGQTSAAAGQQIVVSALVSDAGAGLLAGSVQLEAATVDASSSTGLVMADDGTGADLVAGDNRYTAVLTVTAASSGREAFAVRASDVLGNPAEVSGMILIDNDAPVLTNIVFADSDSIYSNGETVSLVATFDAAGYTVRGDFSAVDGTFVAGSENVVDLGSGIYRIRYTISESNDVPNGEYPVVVTARDAVGLETSGSAPLVLDNEGATVSTVALSDPDDILNADDVITATVSDADNALQAAEYYIDVVGLPGEGTPMAAVDGAFDVPREEVTAPLSIASLSEGQHTLYVRAQDVTGEWGVPQALIFVVDRIPPAIQAVSVTYPENQVEARDTQAVVFTATVTDAMAGVDPARVLLTVTDVSADATDLVMFDDGTNGDAVAGDDVWTRVVEVSSGLTGTFPFTVSAEDIVPNGSSRTGTVRLDNEAPSVVNVVVTDPDNIYANGETVSLEATFDAAGYAVRADFSAVDGTFVAGSEDVQDLDGGVYRVRYTISASNPVANGTYPVVVTARDSVGLEASGSVALVLDNEGATVSTVALSDPDDILNADDVITATVSDADNVLRAAEYYVDVVGLPGEGTPMAAVDGAFDAQTEEVTAPLSIASLSEGQHTLYVRAQDVTGEWGVPQALIFVVDRVPPAIQAVSVTYPENQVEARDTQAVVFTATVTDAVAGVDPARVLLTATDVSADATDLVMFDDGTNGDAVAGDDVWTRVVEVSSGLTGTFTFTVSAEDIVPNGSSRTGTVRLDNEAPVLTVDVAPVPAGGEGLSGQVYDRNVLLAGEYADRPRADRLRTVRIDVRNEAGDHVNDSPIVLTPTAERAFSLQLELVDGHNAVSVIATDLVGNETTVDFVLDFVPAKETQFVDDRGGTVSAPDGTTVVIPPNALLSRQEITISRIDIREFPKPLDDNVRLVGMAHEFGPDGLVFYEPVDVTLAYADIDLDSDQDGVPDIPEEELNVFYWDGMSWIETEAVSRSASDNTVSFTTNHFSVYALGYDASADSFRMYWTRNPFVASEGTTAVIELPSAGRITLQVYDLEGDLVRTVADEDVSGTTNRNWNGLSDFGDYVGSGIYIYTFRFVDGAGSSRVIRKPIGVVE